MKRALTEEQIKEVCQRYLAGESAHSIAKDFNIWATTVCDWLRRMEIPIRPSNEGSLTKDCMESIVALYRSGNSTITIAASLGVNRSQVYKALRRHNVVMDKPMVGKLSFEQARDIIMKREQGISSRTLAKEYGVSKATILKLPNVYDPDGLKAYYASIRTCNDSFFSDVMNPISLYWFGFIAADGCILDDDVISISLKLNDTDHLERMSVDMKSTFPVHQYIYEDRSFCNVQIRSPQMVADLKQLGLGPRKTNSVRWPHLPMWAFRHYLRGYSDGDGCFCTKTRSMAYTLIGNLWFLESARNHLATICQLYPLKLTPHPRSDKAFTFRYAGNTQGLRIANYLYEDAATFLPRKRDIVLNHYQNFPKYRDQLRFG